MMAPPRAVSDQTESNLFHVRISCLTKSKPPTNVRDAKSPRRHACTAIRNCEHSESFGWSRCREPRILLVPAASKDVRKLSTVAPSSPVDLSNAALVRRMLGLAWRYRLGCAQILALQLAQLALSVAALTFLGVAIDVIRHAAVPGSPPPQFPGHWTPPADWTPWEITAAMAAGVLLVGVVRAWVSYVLAVVAARIVFQQIVVALRATVYD